MRFLFYSKQSIFSEDIEWRKLTELFYEGFVTHFSLLSHKFLTERKIWFRTNKKVSRFLYKVPCLQQAVEMYIHRISLLFHGAKRSLFLFYFNRISLIGIMCLLLFSYQLKYELSYYQCAIPYFTNLS